MTPALRWAAMIAIFMFHNCEGQSHKTVSIDHNFRRERRAEADSNRGPAAYQFPLSALKGFRSRCSFCTFSSLCVCVDISPLSAGAVICTDLSIFAPPPPSPLPSFHIHFLGLGSLIGLEADEPLPEIVCERRCIVNDAPKL